MSSSPCAGTYKHLDASQPFEVSFTMADLAARYEKSRYRGDKEMADALEAILNRGLF